MTDVDTIAGLTNTGTKTWLIDRGTKTWLIDRGTNKWLTYTDTDLAHRYGHKDLAHIHRRKDLAHMHGHKKPCSQTQAQTTDRSAMCSHTLQYPFNSKLQTGDDYNRNLSLRHNLNLPFHPTSPHSSHSITAHPHPTPLAVHFFFSQQQQHSLPDYNVSKQKQYALLVPAMTSYDGGSC